MAFVTNVFPVPPGVSKKTFFERLFGFPIFWELIIAPFSGLLHYNDTPGMTALTTLLNTFFWPSLNFEMDKVTKLRNASISSTMVPLFRGLSPGIGGGSPNSFPVKVIVLEIVLKTSSISIKTYDLAI